MFHYMFKAEFARLVSLKVPSLWHKGVWSKKKINPDFSLNVAHVLYLRGMFLWFFLMFYPIFEHLVLISLPFACPGAP